MGLVSDPNKMGKTGRNSVKLVQHKNEEAAEAGGGAPTRRRHFLVVVYPCALAASSTLARPLVP